LALCLSAPAITPGSTDGKYSAILDRNVFGLKPVVPPVLTNDLPPLPRLILIGITTILGDKRVLLKAESQGAKVDPAKNESLILKEGQRAGPVEVLEIDELAGRVKVNNSGKEMTLNFEKDGVKLPATPPPAPAPIAPGQPTAPAVVTASTQTNLVAPGATTRKSRSMLSRNRLTGQVLEAPGNAPAAGPEATLPPLPGTVSSPGNAALPGSTAAAAALPPGLTPEEQKLVLEFQQRGAGSVGSVPPTTAPAPANGNTPGVQPGTPVLPQ
jgi:hypothetical protein